MEFVELEMFRERIKIARNASGLRTGCGIGHALAPAAAVESDDAVSGPREVRDLVRPDVTGARVRVKQNQWHACAAGVREPQLHAGQFSEGANISRHGCLNSRRHRAQDYRAQDYRAQGYRTQGPNKKCAPLDHVISPDIRTLGSKKVWTPGKLAC